MSVPSSKEQFHRARLSGGGAVLAPMAGFSDAPFRLLCREFGAAWAVTEMVSSMGVVMNGKKSFEIGEPYQGEPNLVIQLFGADPQIMAEAGAKLYEEFKPQALDINMGCPVPKIVKNGGGACLLQTPDLAHDLVQALDRAVPIPVSAKIRLGWDSYTALEVAKALEAGGAASIALHGRTRAQAYTGQADWDKIEEVSSSLAVPLIGSGDVVSKELFNARKHKASGVMIGRGAIGRPWIFQEVLGGASLELPEIVRLAYRHCLLNVLWYGEHTGIRQMRGVLPHYFKGFAGANRVRAQMTRVSSLSDVERLFAEIFPDVSLEGVDVGAAFEGHQAASLDGHAMRT
ncbi:MAG: tRNA dihydrouridine synthase [Deinococcales bacterium]